MSKKQCAITIALGGTIAVFSWPVLMVMSDIAVTLTADYKQISYFFSLLFLCKILNSFRLAVTVTMLATLASLFLNYLFFKLHYIRLKKAMLLSLLLLFAISPVIYLVALTRYELFHQLPAFWQSALVLTVNLTPLSFAVVWLAISAIDKDSLTTALLHAPSLSVIQYIVLPQLFAPLSMSSIVVFISVFSQQEVTSFLGYRTYAEDFLSRLIVMTDAREVVVFSLPFIFLSFVAVLFLVVIGMKKHLFGLLSRDRCGFTSLSTLSYKSALSHSLFAALVIASPLFLLISLLSHTVLFDLPTLFSDNFKAIQNSLLTASLVAFAGTVLGNCIYRALCRIPNRLLLLVVTALLFGHWLLPPPLIGLGILKTKQLFTTNLYHYDMLFFCASYLVRILPVTVLLTAILHLVLKPQTDGVVTLMRISRYDIFMKLHLPLNWPRWLLVWSILVVLVLGELAMTILLVPPGLETVIIRIYNLMHYGDYSTVAFLSFIQVALVAAIIITAACLVQHGMKGQ